MTENGAITTTGSGVVNFVNTGALALNANITADGAVSQSGGGTVSVGGHDVVESPLQAKRLIGYLPENAAAYSDMTVQGFLGFAAELRGLAWMLLAVLACCHAGSASGAAFLSGLRKTKPPKHSTATGTRPSSPLGPANSSSVPLKSGWAAASSARRSTWRDIPFRSQMSCAKPSPRR